MAYISSTSSTSSSISGYVNFDSTGSGKTARLYWRIYGGSWSLWNVYDGSSTSSHYFYIGGLSSNTRYQVSVDSYLNGNVTEYGPFIDIYTTSPPLPPPQVPPYSISATPLSQRSPKQMRVSWSSVSGATGYRLYKSSDGSTYFPVTGGDGQVGNTTSYDAIVDYEWQNYWFQVTATNANGNAPNAYNGPWKSNDSYIPIINTFYASDTTKTDRISVYVQGYDQTPDAGTASGVAGAYFWKNGVQVSGAIGANGSGEIFYTYTGLAPDTQYSFYCQIYDADSNFSSSSNTITPRTASNRPTNFEWTYAKTYNTNFKITAAEWTAFQLKINEFRTYKFGVGNNYTFTTAYDGNDFLATHYNEARNAIVNMNSNLPPYRTTGEDVKASEINWLRDALNGVA